MLTLSCFPASLLQVADNGKSPDAQQIVWRLVGAVLGFWESWIHADLGDFGPESISFIYTEITLKMS